MKKTNKTKEIDRKFFGYDLYHAQIHGNLFERVWHRTRVKKVLSSLNAYNTDANILEMGCNTGPLLIALADQGYNPVGVDISIDETQKAAEYLKQMNHPEVTICNADASKMPFKAEQFDCVLMIDFLEHAGGDTQQFVDEAHRVLKPGGTVIVAVPWKYHPVWVAQVKKIMSGRKNIDESPDDFHSKKDLRRLFSTFTEQSMGLKVFFAWLFGIFKKA